ncbi:MAG: helix-turn-helix domain-containing protein [Eubacterium sp.]|nr:helix-turn-helix domain-containing protein [Eubacterium sp.]
MNTTIASILKQLRKSARLSARQVSSELRHYGIDIAAKTLYGYESGISMPNADVFVVLCKIYQCDDPGGLQPPAPAFSQDELSLLKDYQALDPFGQELVRKVIEHEKERARLTNSLP